MPTLEADVDVEREVAELIAMLDGEPECILADVTEFTWRPCRRPAKWIGRLHCGHPITVCNGHYRNFMSEVRGLIECPCGQKTCWSRDPTDVGVLYGGGSYPLTGGPLRLMPL
jgi:hypothetical protein